MLAAIAALEVVCGIMATAFNSPLFSFTPAAHAGKHVAAGIADANLYAQNLGARVPRGSGRCEAGIQLLVDLFEDPFENRFRKGVDSDFGLLPSLRRPYSVSGM